MGNAPMQPGVEGSNGRGWFLFIPLGPAPDIKEAVDQCLDKGHGDFMERARIYHTAWTLLLFGYEGYTIKGDVGNSKFEQIKAQ